MKRMITLPAIDRQVTVGQYVKAIKLAQEHPNEEFKHGLTTWWPTTGKEIMSQFRCGLNERINEAIPYSKRGL